MRLPLELLALLLVLPGAALSQTRSLTVVPHPLEFDPRPELVAASDKLKAAWVDAVREGGDVVTPSRRELDAALAEVGRRDCRTADDCLAALAVKGAGLYAVYAMLELTEAGVFVVTARVVRDDGRLMASFSAQQPRGDARRALLPPVKQVLLDAVLGLGLKALPAFKEAAGAAPPPVAASPEAPAPVVSVPEVASPAAVAPSSPSGRVVTGALVLGLGSAAAVAGGVLVGLARMQAAGLGLDARGFLPADADAQAVARARGANAQHLAGLVTIGAGAAAALTGALLLLAGPSDASVAAVPLAGGAMAVVSGRLP